MSKRGTYTRRACNYCRRRKIKCNGQAPVCSSCSGGGRNCTWDSEQDKKPPTQQLLAAMEQRIKALEYQIRMQGGDPQAADGFVGQVRVVTHRSSSNSITGSDSVPSSPDIAMDMVKTEEDHALEQLCAPTEQLHLENETLQFYGPTSLFRLGHQISHSRTSSMDTSDNLCLNPLVLDGCSPLELEWDRYLPPKVPLSRPEHDHLLDMFFRFFTSWRMCIIPAFFLRDMYRYLSVPRNEDPPITNHYSPMLHNAIIALASAFSDNALLKHVSTRRVFANKAKEDVEKECSQPSLSAVIALSFLASFHSSQGEHELGYTYFGMSTRMSYTLGLHIDCSAWVKKGLRSQTQMWDRNWLYWNMTTLDVFWSLFVGRDSCLPDPDQRSPGFEFHHSFTWNMPPLDYRRDSQDPNSGSNARVFIATCQLLKIGRNIIRAVNKLSDCKMLPEEINSLLTSLDLQLAFWKESLPDDIDIKAGFHASNKASPPRLMMQMAYHSLLVVLHRPFCLRNEREDQAEHFKICCKNAGCILSLATAWRTAFSLRFVPMSLVQVLSCSGTVFVLSAVQAARKVRCAPTALQSSLDQAEKCINYLREIGETWECSNTMADILSGLLRDQVQRRLAAKDISPNPSSPGSFHMFRVQVPISSSSYLGQAQPSVPQSLDYGSAGMHQPAQVLPPTQSEFSAPSGDSAIFGALHPGYSDYTPGAQFFSIQNLAVMQADFLSLEADIGGVWIDASNETSENVHHLQPESYTDFPSSDMPMSGAGNYTYSSTDVNSLDWNQYHG